MKRINISVLALSAILFAGSALAGSCPRHVKEIDAELGNYPSLSKSEINKVKGLRNKGEAFHKAGKHSESVEALMEAKGLLGI